jgi:hypothetical protein
MREIFVRFPCMMRTSRPTLTSHADPGAAREASVICVREFFPIR